jgi:hypothetical protein
MKHLFLVILSLTFSVCAFSQQTDTPVPDKPTNAVYSEFISQQSATLSYECFALESPLSASRMAWRLHFRNAFKRADESFNINY